MASCAWLGWLPNDILPATPGEDTPDPVATRGHCVFWQAMVEQGRLLYQQPRPTLVFDETRPPPFRPLFGKRASLPADPASRGSTRQTPATGPGAGGGRWGDRSGSYRGAFVEAGSWHRLSHRLGTSPWHPSPPSANVEPGSCSQNRILPGAEQETSTMRSAISTVFNSTQPACPPKLSAESMDRPR
jgi:hypothetical protein